MEYPFPPVPPGYTIVLVVRWLLVAWAIIGIGIIIVRLQNWKFIQNREMVLWALAVAFCFVIAQFGICPYRRFDNNKWLVPAETAAISVSMAGIGMGLSKRDADKFKTAKTRSMEMGIVVVVSIIVAVVLCGDPMLPWGEGSRTRCKNNLKQIGLSMHNYHDVYGSFPASANGDQPISWRVSILPHFDQALLFEQYDQQRTWDHEPNDRVAQQIVEGLICTSNYSARQDSQARWFTAYSMPTGPHTVGENPNGTSIKNITDGTSNTLLVVEACGAQIVWTEPRDVDIATRPTGINLKGTRPGQSAGWLSSYHTGGTNVLFADGRVRYVSADTDAALLKKMATIDGGESFDLD